MLAKDLSGVAVFLVCDGEQQMFGRDKLVLHLVRLLLRGGEYLSQARTKVLLSALHPRKASHCGLRIVEHHRDVRSELSQDWSNYTFRLLEHGHEQMLGLDLLV